MDSDIVLSAKNLSKQYDIPQGMFKPDVPLKALNNASFTLRKGKTLAVVGESGCGKTTLAQLVAMINIPSGGSLEIKEQEIVGASSATLNALRSSVQIVFQNPYGSL
ncbi:MAG: ATP-binding cassette domain-containing protein, partial [Arenicellales bacterium]